MLEELAATDPLLAEELKQLTPSQRELVRIELVLRKRATFLSKQLGIDEEDVYYQLKQLLLTPTERLRRGLRHGRFRRKLL